MIGTVDVLIVLDNLVGVRGFEFGLQGRVRRWKRDGRDGAAAAASEWEGGELVGVAAAFGVEGVD